MPERPVILSAELATDPHGMFRHWRQRVAVIEMRDGACTLSRAADLERLLTDPRTRQIDGAHYARLCGARPGPLFDLFSQSLPMSSGDMHRRRRASMARAMAFRAQESMRTFAISRQDHPRWHLVFGGGRLRCIGEALGRLELEEGLMALSRRLPDLRLVGPAPELKGRSGIGRPSSLLVAW